MKVSLKRSLILMLALVMALSMFAGCGGAAAPASSATPAASSAGTSEPASEPVSEPAAEASYYPVTFTDMGGNEVTIEKEPEKIAALMGGTYENIVWCDPSWADKIVTSMTLSDSQWRDLMAPNREDMIQSGPAINRDPNVEELAELGVDTVFYWSDLDDIKAQMEALGMTVIECGSSVGAPTTPEEVIETEVAKYRMYGAALNCADKAEAYEQYVTDMITMVTDRTSKLTEAEKPSVYLARSDLSGLEYFPWPGSYPYLAELAGATYVDHGTTGGASATATMEQMMAWDPEYVFMCWGNTTEQITGSSEWQSISAVKDGHVFLLPAADSAYLPTSLWLLYMAQSMHPELFEDVDFVEEIQNFYGTFRNFELSDEQAQYIYERRQPDGSSRATAF